MRKVLLFTAAGALALGLAACNGKPSAVAPQNQDAATQSQGFSNADRGGGGAADPRAAPVPMVNGKPMWAANRKHTAEENARYQFAKNGGDFDAKSETDYITRAHKFVDQPPGGVQTLDRRNGDRLIYDPKANVFAVVTKDGAPRTMFKPRDGAAYWTAQKDRETKRGKNEPGGADQG